MAVRRLNMGCFPLSKALRDKLERIHETIKSMEKEANKEKLLDNAKKAATLTKVFYDHL